MRLPLQTGAAALGMLMLAAGFFGATLVSALIVVAMFIGRDVEAKFKLLAVMPLLVHLPVVKRSLCRVSAIVPPSARNMPYFCSARATTFAPALGSESTG